MPGEILVTVAAIAGVSAAVAAAAPDPAGAGARASHCRPALTARAPERRLDVPILMYHRVNVVTAATPAVSRRLTVSPGDFARQLAWLHAHGYRTITQRELFDALQCGARLGPHPVLLTFDDGYRDVFFRASPTLRRYGMRATAYVISGRISNRDPDFLTWPLLHALERRGIEIGSHTVAHRDLRTLSDVELLRELVASRRMLERRLRHPVRWLAYPFGSTDARVEAAARRAGYLLATTTVAGTSQSASRPLALRRLRVLDTTGVDGLARMLGGS